MTLKIRCKGFACGSVAVSSRQSCPRRMSTLSHSGLTSSFPDHEPSEITTASAIVPLTMGYFMKSDKGGGRRIDVFHVSRNSMSDDVPAA
ncbi:MAG TPA: hypothetical protein VFC46_11775 [Humisphaera sp.]|nr:hypothetical protein [Humisphaera sp.]